MSILVTIVTVLVLLIGVYVVRYVLGTSILYLGRKYIDPSFTFTQSGVSLRDIALQVTSSNFSWRLRIRKVSLRPWCRYRNGEHATSRLQSLLSAPSLELVIGCVYLQVQEIDSQGDSPIKLNTPKEAAADPSDNQEDEPVQLLSASVLAPLLRFLCTVCSAVIGFLQDWVAPALLSHLHLIITDVRVEVFGDASICTILSYQDGFDITCNPRYHPSTNPPICDINIDSFSSSGIAKLPLFVHVVTESPPDPTWTSPISPLLLRDSDVLLSLKWDRVRLETISGRSSPAQLTYDQPTPKLVVHFSNFKWHHLFSVESLKSYHHQRSQTSNSSSPHTTRSRRNLVLPSWLLRCDYAITLQQFRADFRHSRHSEGREDYMSLDSEEVCIDCTTRPIHTSASMKEPSARHSLDTQVTVFKVHSTDSSISIQPHEPALATLGECEVEFRCHAAPDGVASTITLSLDGEEAQIHYSRSILDRTQSWFQQTLKGRSATSSSSSKDAAVPTPSKVLKSDLMDVGIDVELVIGIEMRSGALIFSDSKTTASVELWRTSVTYGKDTAYHVSLESKASLLLLVGEVCPVEGAESQLDRILSASMCSFYTKIDLFRDPFLVCVKSPTVNLDGLILELTPGTVHSLYSLIESLSSRGRRVRALTVDPTSSPSLETGKRPLVLQDPIHISFGDSVCNLYSVPQYRAAQFLAQGLRIAVEPSGSINAVLDLFELRATDDPHAVMSATGISIDRDPGFRSITCPDLHVSVSPERHQNLLQCLGVFADKFREIRNSQGTEFSERRAGLNQSDSVRSISRMTIHHLNMVASGKPTDQPLVLIMDRMTGAVAKGFITFSVESVRTGFIPDRDENGLRSFIELRKVFGCRTLCTSPPQSVTDFVSDSLVHGTREVSKSPTMIFLGLNCGTVSLVLSPQIEWSFYVSNHVFLWQHILGVLSPDPPSTKATDAHQGLPSGATRALMSMGTFSFEQITVHLLDDPFEVQLGLNYQLHVDEYYQRRKREVAVFERLESGPKPSAAKVLSVKQRLDKENSNIYCERVMSLAKDHERREFMLAVTIGPLVCKFEQTSDKETEFTATVSASNGLQAQLRDHPIPLFTVSAFDISSTVRHGGSQEIIFNVNQCYIAIGPSSGPVLKLISDYVSRVYHNLSMVQQRSNAKTDQIARDPRRYPNVVALEIDSLSCSLLLSRRDPYNDRDLVPIVAAQVSFRQSSSSIDAGVTDTELRVEEISLRSPSHQGHVCCMGCDLAVSCVELRYRSSDEESTLKVSPETSAGVDNGKRNFMSMNGSLHYKFVEKVSKVAPDFVSMYQALLKPWKPHKISSTKEPKSSTQLTRVNGVIGPSNVSLVGSLDRKVAVRLVLAEGYVQGLLPSNNEGGEVTWSCSQLSVSYRDRIQGASELETVGDQLLCETGVILVAYRACSDGTEFSVWEVSVNDFHLIWSARARCFFFDWYALFRVLFQPLVAKKSPKSIPCQLDGEDDEGKASKADCDTPLLVVVLHRPQVLINALNQGRLWFVAQSVTGQLNEGMSTADMQLQHCQIFDMPSAINLSQSTEPKWLSHAIVVDPDIDPDEMVNHLFNRLFHRFDISVTSKRLECVMTTNITVPSLEARLDSRQVQCLISVFKFMTRRLPHLLSSHVGHVTEEMLNGDSLGSSLSFSPAVLDIFVQRKQAMRPSSEFIGLVTRIELLESDIQYLRQVQSSAEAEQCPVVHLDQALRQYEAQLQRAIQTLKAIITSTNDDSTSCTSHVSTTRLSYKLGKLRWSLLARGRPFMELLVESFQGSRERFSGGAGISTVEAGFIVAETSESGSRSPRRVLGPHLGSDSSWNAQAQGNSYNIRMLKLAAELTKPIGGVTVYSHWHLQMFPMRIDITREQYKSIYEYVFPKEDRFVAPILVNEASHLRANSDQLQTIRESISNSFTEPGLKEGKIEAETMSREDLRHQRAKTNVFFRKFTIDANMVCLTYSTDGKVPTFQEWIVQVPAVQFENLTASWKKCYSLAKKSITVSLVKQSATKAVPAAWQLLRSALTTADMAGIDDTQANPMENKRAESRMDLESNADLLLGSQSQVGREYEKLLLGSGLSTTRHSGAFDNGPQSGSVSSLQDAPAGDFDGDNEGETVSEESRLFLQKAFARK